MAQRLVLSCKKKQKESLHFLPPAGAVVTEWSRHRWESSKMLYSIMKFKKVSFLLLILQGFVLFSCSKDQTNEIDEPTAKIGDWKYAYTWKGLGKDCVAPPKDCGAFQYGEEAKPIQNNLDKNLNVKAVELFFDSENANELFPNLDVTTLLKLQSGKYKLVKYTNTNGDDFYFGGQGNVSMDNFEFVLKLDKQ